MISAEHLREILHYDPDTGVFTNRTNRSANARVGDVAGTVGQIGYRYIRFNNRLLGAHRLAWLYAHGKWPSEVDHINRIRDDNRLVNLRECSRCQNNANSSVRKDNSTGIKNISITPRGKYLVRFKVDGRCLDLGYFTSLSEAAVVRNKYALKIHGEFADNYISEHLTSLEKQGAS